MFSELEVCNAKDIAAKVFASTPAFVLQQKECGRFPHPSWRTPGNRGKLVWLVATVELWLQEYEERAPKPNGGQASKEFRAACNDAAVTATRIAEQFDAEFKRKILSNRHVGSVSSKESTDERNSPAVVA